MYFQGRVVSEALLEETERACGWLGKSVLDVGTAGAEI